MIFAHSDLDIKICLEFQIWDLGFKKINPNKKPLGDCSPRGMDTLLSEILRRLPSLNQ
jgi:hypothetical protein